MRDKLRRVWRKWLMARVAAEGGRIVEREAAMAAMAWGDAIQMYVARSGSLGDGREMTRRVRRRLLWSLGRLAESFEASFWR
jgi:hypothetical protein